MLVKPYDAARHTTGVTGGVATVTRQQASARGVYAVRMHHAAINAGPSWHMCVLFVWVASGLHTIRFVVVLYVCAGVACQSAV